MPPWSSAAPSQPTWIPASSPPRPGRPLARGAERHEDDAGGVRVGVTAGDVGPAAVVVPGVVEEGGGVVGLVVRTHTGQRLDGERRAVGVLAGEVDRVGRDARLRGVGVEGHEARRRRTAGRAATATASSAGSSPAARMPRIAERLSEDAVVGRVGRCRRGRRGRGRPWVAPRPRGWRRGEASAASVRAARARAARAGAGGRAMQEQPDGSGCCGTDGAETRGVPFGGAVQGLAPEPLLVTTPLPRRPEVGRGTRARTRARDPGSAP